LSISFEKGSYRERLVNRIVSYNLITSKNEETDDEKKLSETQVFQMVKDCRFDAENLSSAIHLDHIAEKVIVLLNHVDADFDKALLLAAPFSPNTLEVEPQNHQFQ
jgi:hypothetical protein